MMVIYFQTKVLMSQAENDQILIKVPILLPMVYPTKKIPAQYMHLKSRGKSQEHDYNTTKPKYVGILFKQPYNTLNEIKYRSHLSPEANSTELKTPNISKPVAEGTKLIGMAKDKLYHCIGFPEMTPYTSQPVLVKMKVSCFYNDEFSATGTAYSKQM